MIHEVSPSCVIVLADDLFGTFIEFAYLRLLVLVSTMIVIKYAMHCALYLHLYSFTSLCCCVSLSVWPESVLRVNSSNNNVLPIT